MQEKERNLRLDMLEKGRSLRLSKLESKPRMKK